MPCRSGLPRVPASWQFIPTLDRFNVYFDSESTGKPPLPDLHNALVRLVIHASITTVTCNRPGHGLFIDIRSELAWQSNDEKAAR